MVVQQQSGTRWGEVQRAGAAVAGARLQALDALRRKLHQSVISELGPVLYDQGMAEAEIRARVEEELHRALAQERLAITADERRAVVGSIFDDVLGYGPIDRLLRDPEVDEVMVNGPDRVYVESGGRLRLTDVTFVDEAHVRRIVDKIVSQVGRRVDEATPMVDARLPDGSRVNVMVHPLAREPSPEAVGDVVCQSRATQRSAHSATSSLSPFPPTPYAISRCCARVAAFPSAWLCYGSNSHRA